jgi:hypothetical protein
MTPPAEINMGKLRLETAVLAICEGTGSTA